MCTYQLAGLWVKNYDLISTCTYRPISHVLLKKNWTIAAFTDTLSKKYVLASN